MALGIIIHITVGPEKRTEFFSQDRIKIGSDDLSDLQIHARDVATPDLWFELESTDGVYRIIEFDQTLDLHVNDKPIRRYIAIGDGDVIRVGTTNVAFSFFSQVLNFIIS